jgi:hypothetical protein
MSVPGQEAAQAPDSRATARPVNRDPVGARWTRPDAAALLVVAALTVVGVALRLVVAHEALFADELSTYWIIDTHGLRGVISTVHTDAEITPPLYFVLSWIAIHAGHGAELVRAPSLVAGALTIPIVYLLGLRTVGRPAALVATALTTFAPFMVYYSAEARAYGLMMGLTAASTLAMLIAVERRRAGWWVLYAACSCLAVYSHYTCVFALGAQLLWLLWAHPEARRAAILANVGAVVAFAPWTTGAINDFTSPTSKILTALSPFTVHDVWIVLQHWSVGYPYGTVPLKNVPGTSALVLLALAALVCAAGIAARTRTQGLARLRRLDRGVVLVVAVMLSVPVCEAVASAVSTHLFGVRNLAAAWPATALVSGALLTAAGPRLRYAAAGLAIASSAIGAGRIVERTNGRPDFRGAAAYVDARIAPRDVIIDETANLSPGPYSPMDLTLRGGNPVLRAGAPQERDHPFNVFDANVRVPDAVARAVAKAQGGRIFLVGYVGDRRLPVARFPAPWRRTANRTFPGFLTMRVQVYSQG